MFEKINTWLHVDILNTLHYGNHKLYFSFAFIIYLLAVAVILSGYYVVIYILKENFYISLVFTMLFSLNFIFIYYYTVRYIQLITFYEEKK